MLPMPFSHASDRPLSSSSHDALADYRERRAVEEHERAERRRLELAEQHSTFNTADARIRAWEKVHHLRMPSDPTHAVLEIIAAATQLTLEEVRQEQQSRASRLVSGSSRRSPG
jgi:hypothetical protein